MDRGAAQRTGLTSRRFVPSRPRSRAGPGSGTRSTPSSWAGSRRWACPRPRGRPSDPDPPTPVRPDRPAADARGGRRLRQRPPARRLRAAGRPAPRRATSTASAGRGCGSTWPGYAESDGFKSDKTRPNAWRYRDWVIRALNADLPYDRFLTLQLAGDEVAPSDPDAFVATGFNRNWPFEDNNKVPGLNRQLMLDDMTDTTASVVLGMTLACARCHDHKFDPISQKDYYRFQALFAADRAEGRRPARPAARGGLPRLGRGRAPGPARPGQEGALGARTPLPRRPPQGQARHAPRRGPQGARHRPRGADRRRRKTCSRSTPRT